MIHRGSQELGCRFSISSQGARKELAKATIGAMAKKKWRFRDARNESDREFQWGQRRFSSVPDAPARGLRAVTLRPNCDLTLVDIEDIETAWRAPDASGTVDAVPEADTLAGSSTVTPESRVLESISKWLKRSETFGEEVAGQLKGVLTGGKALRLRLDASDAVYDPGNDPQFLALYRKYRSKVTSQEPTATPLIRTPVIDAPVEGDAWRPLEQALADSAEGGHATLVLPQVGELAIDRIGRHAQEATVLFVFQARMATGTSLEFTPRAAFEVAGAVRATIGDLEESYLLGRDPERVTLSDGTRIEVTMALGETVTAATVRDALRRLIERGA